MIFVLYIFQQHRKIEEKIEIHGWPYKKQNQKESEMKNIMSLKEKKGRQID